MRGEYKLRKFENKIALVTGGTSIKNFGCNRFVYNYYLDKIKNSKLTNVYDYINAYVHNLKLEYSFLQEADSALIRKSIFHLENNMKRFFNSGFGYPKFKSKYDNNAYTTSAVYRSYKDSNYCNNIEINLEKELGRTVISNKNSLAYKYIDEQQKIESKVNE